MQLIRNYNCPIQLFTTVPTLFTQRLGENVLGERKREREKKKHLQSGIQGFFSTVAHQLSLVLASCLVTYTLVHECALIRAMATRTDGHFVRARA